MTNPGNKIEITKMPLNKIKLGRNSRVAVDATELDGLMESIKQVGLLQPIGVVKNGTGYNIAYGNRRFLACSKLGYTHIAAIIHTSKKASDIDIKNLAENVQRKNISLTEVGRYVHLLTGDGMTRGEIAVRLGVSQNYVQTCEKAFGGVPKEFRDLLVQPVGNERTAVGKIAAGTAMKIMNAVRTYQLSNKEERELYKAAKEKDDFEPKLIKKYARQVKAGHKNFVESQKPLKHVRLDFMIAQDEYDKLQVKYVDEGPFTGIRNVLKAALMGKISLNLAIINEK